MSTWATIIAAGVGACQTPREQRTHLNDVLQAAWALEPQTAAERAELRKLESEAILAVPRIGTTKYGGCNPIGGRGK